MQPKWPPSEQPELFRSALVNLVDRRHPLVRLAGLIDWDRFATAFGPLYREGVGRPGLPTRLMVGLHLIKHMDGLSDAAVCARFLDSPYVQLFCGETHFLHALPLDRSSMTRWRKRIGTEPLELLLAETLAAAQRAGAAAPKHFERVTIDTTVQPKAVMHPTDSKLLHRGRHREAERKVKLNVTVSGDNWFIRTGSGTDALAAHGGRNVLDGGTGSNFLSGAWGEDTFFLDARGATEDIWSTVVGFGSGDAVTVWGTSPQDGAIRWIDDLGAAGYTGLTMQATAAGKPNALVTLAGCSRADLDSGRLQVTFGSSDAAGPYMHIHGVT